MFKERPTSNNKKDIKLKGIKIVYGDDNILYILIPIIIVFYVFTFSIGLFNV